MKSFKLFLENRENLTSWLNPSGKFFPVQGSQTHTNLAIQITHQAYPKCFQILLNKGWQRINYINNNLYAYNTIKPPNQSQLDSLIELAMINKINNIYYDNERSDEILWTNPLDLN